MLEKIILTLKEELEPLDYVYSFWLEGSYALGLADSFSDLDCCVNIADDKVNDVLVHVENALQKIGSLDKWETVKNKNSKLGQKVYHIVGTSPYLLIDFNWQMSSGGNRLVFKNI